MGKEVRCSFVQQSLFQTCSIEQEESTQVSYVGKTSRVHFHRIGDVILKESSKKSRRPKFQFLQADDGQSPAWLEAEDVTCPGVAWTLNIGESPNVAIESSLSQILDKGGVAPKYFLSSRACQGILNRAAKRGKPLPEVLKAVLTRQATQPVCDTEESARGVGPLVQTNRSGTLSTSNDQTIFCIGHDERNGGVQINQCQTLAATDYKRPPVITDPNNSQGKYAIETCYDPCQRSDVIREYDDGKSPTITQMCGSGGGNVPFVLGGVSSALKAHNASDNGSLRIENMRARRLTPSECEKLQGLPGNWTEGISDTARYRMIGNGMAQPCADFVMGAVVKALSKENENE